MDGNGSGARKTLTALAILTLTGCAWTPYEPAPASAGAPIIATKIADYDVIMTPSGTIYCKQIADFIVCQ